MQPAPSPSGDRVRNALLPVIDPELGASIVDLGLIYAIEVSADGRVVVDFTAAVPGGPVISVLEHSIVQAVSRLAGVTSVEARFVTEPPWDPSMIPSLD
jgi:metal-sulfur cluster biosynthetic enzyme